MSFDQFHWLMTEASHQERLKKLFSKLDREEGAAFVYHLLESLVK